MFAESAVDDPAVYDPWFTPADVKSGPNAEQPYGPFGAAAADLSVGVHPLPPTHEQFSQAVYPLSDEQGAGSSFGFDLLMRGYYLNDQRMAWSGLEETFGAEAVLVPVVSRRFGPWETTLEGEFYLNQPFNQNILVDTAERSSYRANFDVKTFEISKLLLAVRNGNWEFVVGKMETPFGRTRFPLFSNARADAPFIRTESILWRETGLLVRYRPGLVVCDAAVVNGCEDRDTNSSKGLISRIALEAENWAVGASVKVQDGIGSEGQKTFNNHVGMDFMLRYGRFTFSGEVIYDEYGFHRPGFDPNDITWPRSIYYRDQHLRWATPICGLGYYVDLGFQTHRWTVGLNYGDFYPQAIGDPRHDEPTRRGIVRLSRSFTPGLQGYGVMIIENEGHNAQAGRPRRGEAVLVGMQYVF